MIQILIVEDYFIIAEKLVDTLEGPEYRVLGVAGSGEEAVATAPRLNPDVILMDIVMPGGMDGITAARKIMTLIDAAVVFITGHEEKEIIERAKKVCAHGFVLKPFLPGEIRAAVEIGLHRRDMELEVGRIRKSLENDVQTRTAHLERTREQMEGG